jgi:hypothetical protein
MKLIRMKPPLTLISLPVSPFLVIGVRNGCAPVYFIVRTIRPVKDNRKYAIAGDGFKNRKETCHIIFFKNLSRNCFEVSVRKNEVSNT